MASLDKQQLTGTVPNEVSIEDIANSLITNAAHIVEFSRSFMMRTPESVRSFAKALEKISDIPYECVFSFEPRRDRFVITTGGEQDAVPFQDVDLARRITDGAPYLHNHPVAKGVVKTTPSFADMATLIALSSNGNPRASFIISKYGITRYEIPSTITHFEEYFEMFQNTIEIISRNYNLPGKPFSEYTDEEIRTSMDAEREAAAQMGISFEEVTWDETERIDELLTEFLNVRTKTATK